MKKEIAVITLNGLDNFGNRLQNYALIKYIQDNYNCNCYNIWKISYVEKLKNFIKKQIPLKKYKRLKSFIRFNNHITKRKEKNDNMYKIVGSDQVWNPNWAATDELLLINEKGVKISYAASFGVSEIPIDLKEKFKNAFSDFKYISVREDAGKKIVEELTGRNDIEVLIDPTMLLETEQWEKIMNKPNFHNKEKYILIYFLGNISQKRRTAINKIALEKGYKIIDILDKTSQYYTCGPSEFLWLEKNAEFICTDSFHSAVFSMLFNKPFIVFDREQDGMNNMSSRIDTLLNKFELKNRKFDGESIKDLNIQCDYKKAYEILKKEKEKSKKFFDKSII